MAGEWYASLLVRLWWLARVLFVAVVMICLSVWLSSTKDRETLQAELAARREERRRRREGSRPEALPAETDAATKKDQ